MKRYLHKKTVIGFTLFCSLIFIANSGSHPTNFSNGNGYTGAPNDSACTQCHSPGGNLDGTVNITGLPSTVSPNQTYPLTVTIVDTSPALNASRAGFQMVSLKQNLANGGTFSTAPTETSTSVKTSGGKSYIGHQPAKNFPANNTVTFDVEWTAPASATGPITLYIGSLLGNGGNGNNQDKFIASSVSTEIGAGNNLDATFSNVIPTSCSDTADGSATVNASGGSGGYMYQWDNGESSATAIMLTGGMHEVTVTDNSNASIVVSVEIEAPAEISLSIISQSDATCNNTPSGSAEVSAMGGNGGFSYNWGNGISGAIQNNLAAGTYNVTATDINGCTQEVLVVIDQPQPITINIIENTMPSCTGATDGLISVEATGGNGGFSYSWLTGGIGTPLEGTITDLPAGSYLVEVFDSEGCTNEIEITLNDPEAITIDVITTDINCFGDQDGTATASAVGGTGTLTYAWSNGGEGSEQLNLALGMYSVTVSDINGCTSSADITINGPASEVTAGIVVITQPNCGSADGALSVFGDGGIPDYTFEWSNGSIGDVLSDIPAGFYSVTVTDVNECTASAEIMLTDVEGILLAVNDVTNNTCNGDNTGSATISADGGVGDYTYQWSNGGTNATETALAAGAYTVTVTDIGGCVGMISFDITEPLPFTANETITHISCHDLNDGNISISPSGGTGTLTYTWNTGSTDSSISDLVPGLYSVEITDELGCTLEFEFVITEPDEISLEVASIGLPLCPGDSSGMIALDVTGGTGMLSYLWNTGATESSISGLVAGDYSLTVTDERGCVSEASFTLDDPEEISVISTSILPTCSDSEDGSINVIASGGNGEYTYMWSTNQNSETISNISAGVYTLNVTDGNECSNTFDFVLDAPLQIDANITVTDVTENGANDGTATSAPTNGTAPYTYLWSNGETTPSITDLMPGMYSLLVTDANGCTVDVSILINNGDCNIDSDVNITNISCFGAEDGTIEILLEGAVSPIAYSWNTGATESTLTNLVEGIYSVTATDANGCLVQIVDMTITAPDALAIENIVISDASNSESEDGSISFDISGGTGQYTIQFTDETGAVLDLESSDNIGPGIYGILIMDENGCTLEEGPFEIGVLSSIDDVSLEAVLYPNPARNILTLEVDQVLKNTPQVYSLNGQTVDVSISSNNGTYQLDISQIQNGVYCLQVSTGHRTKYLKFLVAK